MPGSVDFRGSRGCENRPRSTISEKLIKNGGSAGFDPVESSNSVINAGVLALSRRGLGRLVLSHDRKWRRFQDL
jgi:hypothetical protein